MPTTLSALGLPIGRPAPAIQRQFQLTLYQADGSTPAASLSGLWWAWWATVAGVRSGPPDASGSGAATDPAGVFTANAPNILTAGTEQGYGIVSNQDATADATEAAYTGAFDVI